jgi:hypothetical protein
MPPQGSRATGLLAALTPQEGGSLPLQFGAEEWPDQAQDEEPGGEEQRAAEG